MSTPITLPPSPPLRSKERVEAGPRTQVNDRLTFFDGRQRNGVAAAQAQVCAFRNGLHILIAIADLPADILGKRRASTARGAGAAAAGFHLGYSRVTFSYYPLDLFVLHGVCLTHSSLLPGR